MRITSTIVATTIELLGSIIGQVESGMRKLGKIKFLIAENGARTVLGSDWLNDLGIKLKTERGECEIDCVSEPRTNG